MINHFRTLLLNKNGATRPASSFYLEEFVPTDFLSVQLPQQLQRVYDAILGSKADNAFANLRMRQFIQLVHSTELVEYVTALDPRITYDLNRSALNTNYGSSYTSKSDVILSFIGEVLFSSATPKLIHQWEILALDSSHIRISALPSGPILETAVSFAHGLSGVIYFPGQANFGFRLGADSLTADDTWRVEVKLEPTSDVSDLVSKLENIGDDTTAYIFTNTEPYKTFNEIWQKHWDFHYRLSAFILAYVYRIEEVRLNGR